MAVKFDAFSACVPKYNEVFCEDQSRILRNESGVAAILADGTNGGAKANLLTSFAVRMMTAMQSSGISIRQLADMMVEFQPADGKAENADNTGFTLIFALFDGEIHVEQFETPDVILLRRGKPVPMETARRVLHGKTIRSGTIPVKQADTVIAVGNGMLAAGAGRNLKDGWNVKAIAAYMANAYEPQITAETITRLLLAAGSSLFFERPENDLSALAIRMEDGVRQDRTANAFGD